MINCIGTYANVFDVEDKGKYVKAHISTSRKDQNDEYINSNWFAYFFGKAKDKAAALEDKSRIFILQGGVTCEKFDDDDGDSKYFTSVKIFDFVTLETNSSTKKSTKKKKVDDEDDEDEPAPKKATKKTAKKTTSKKKKVEEYDEDSEDDDDDGVPF
jgi:hypothetical protein